MVELPLNHIHDIAVNDCRSWKVLSATKNRLGVSRLPCRLGDTEQSLVRIEPLKLVNDLDIWLLMHRDLQQQPRVRAFADFIYAAFQEERTLFEGVA